MITVVGLGPGELGRVPSPVRSLLLDPGHAIVVRTARHPASEELAVLRDVTFCDDLYEADSFDEVYEAIARRVVESAADGPVVYAVPGSPLVGELAVRRILEMATDVSVLPGESFLDAVLAEIGYDPLERGLQLLNGHRLPDPLVLDKPTVIAHLDRPEVLGDVLASVGSVIPEDAEITLLSGLGAPGAVVVTDHVTSIDPALAGLRTSLWVDTEPAGLVGAVHVMRRLRAECPWDRDQTHQSLVKNLIEETYELVDAIGRLDPAGGDWVGYAAVEDELGDVLLQVLFHEAIGRESRAFDIDGIAGVLREKLIRRHPHVFADLDVADAAEVKRNWDRIKAEETGPASSALDGLPTGMPAVQRAAKVQNRAAKVGFDWEEAAEVLPKVAEELSELERAMNGEGDVDAELGDVLFSVVNLARHLGIDPELALRDATGTFERRFRRMESEGPLLGLDLDELDERWERAKRGD